MATSAGSPVVAKAIVTIIPSMEGSRGKISDMILPESDKAGKQAGSNIGGKISEGLSTAKLAIGNALGNIISSAVSSAAGLVKDALADSFNGFADYQQLVGGVDTLFKDSSSKVKDYAKDAFKTAGVSANQYMETVTGFSSSLIQSLGGDTEKAADLANTALVDMSDNANKMGSDISSIELAYQGFARQQYGLLDNLKLGYGGTKKEMERLLKDASELTKAQGNYREFSIDSYSDIIEAIHLVQENIGITGTTTEEAATTIQGAMGMAKSAWDNWLTGLANPDADMGQLTKDLVSSLKTALANVLPAVKDMFSGIGEGIVDMLREAGLGGVADFFEALSSKFQDEGLLKIFGNIMDNFGSIGKGFADAVNAVAPSAEELAVFIADIVGGIADFVWSITSAADYMPSFSDVFEFVADIGGRVVEIFRELWPVVSELAMVLGQVFGSALSTAFNVLKAVGTALMDVFGPPIQRVIQWINDNIGSIENVIYGITAAITGLVDGIVSFFTESEAGKSLINELSGLLGDVLIGALDLLIFQINLVMEVVDAVVGFFQNDPIGQEIASIVNGIITVISDALSVIRSLIKTAMGFIKGLLTGDFSEMLEGASELFGDLETMTKDSGDLLGRIVQTIFDAIGRIAQNACDAILGTVGNALTDMAKGIQELPGKIVDFFAHLPEQLGDVFSLAVQFILDNFGDLIASIASIPDQIIDFFASIPSRIASIFSNIKVPQLHVSGEWNLDPANFSMPHIEFYAKGGIVTKPTNAVIGEAGYPEAVIPLTSRYLAPLLEAADIGGKGGDTYNVINGLELAPEDYINDIVVELLEWLYRKAAMQRG